MTTDEAVAAEPGAADRLLREHQVDPVTGFLPPQDPFTQLPGAFAELEQLAAALPKLLAADQARQAIADADLRADPAMLTTSPQRERAMLLLSYLGHAYVFADTEPQNRIPANLAQPWWAAARAVGRPPVLSYASHALVNWRRIDAGRPVELGNLVRLQNFLGGLDEDWFVLVHIAIEALAGPGLHAAARAQQAAAANDAEGVAAHLHTVSDTLQRMLATLRRMPEHCDPYIYYHRVRPFIFGWKDNPALPQGVVYDGVAAYAGRPQQMRGETGAQSSVIPAFDAMLGLDYSHDPLGTHLIELRAYMPPGHREFLTALAQGTSVRAYTLRHTDSPALVDAYNRCVALTGDFRRQHMAYARAYVHAQQPTSPANPVATGTGGTPFMTYLEEHVRATDRYLVIDRR